MVHQRPIDALVFDYDGVIADTEPLHWKSWAALLEPRGIHFTWDEYCRIGRGVHDVHMIDALKPLVKDSSVLFGLEEQFALRNEAVQELCARNSPIHEATVEMLKSLKGCRLGLVTSSMKSDVEPVLRAAGVLSCFDGAVFGDDVERRKPWPDPYLLAGRLLGIETGLAFEDSDAGIASAENAGFVGIRVDDPEQLDQIVRRAIRDFPNKPIKGPAR